MTVCETTGLLPTDRLPAPPQRALHPRHRASCRRLELPGRRPRRGDGPALGAGLPRARVSRVFRLLPADAVEWGRREGLAQAPEAGCGPALEDVAVAADARSGAAGALPLAAAEPGSVHHPHPTRPGRHLRPVGGVTRRATTPGAGRRAGGIGRWYRRHPPGKRRARRDTPPAALSRPVAIGAREPHRRGRRRRRRRAAGRERGRAFTVLVRQPRAGSISNPIPAAHNIMSLTTLDGSLRVSARRRSVSAPPRSWPVAACRAG